MRREPGWFNLSPLAEAGLACRFYGCTERTGQLLVNGVNTIPGMAATSVFPKVMRAAGYTYPELLAELCRLAAQG